MARYCFLIITAIFLTSACADKRQVDGDEFFISLSDIHFDPFIACYKEKQKPCPLIVSLRQSPVSQWAKVLASYDHTQPAYRLDTNYPLLQSSLQAASDVAKEDKAKFVLVLGDFLGHGYRKYYKKFSGDKSYSGYKAFAQKTIAFLTLSLKESFPGVSVIPVVGNNDTYMRDYQTAPNSAFFKETSSEWARLQTDKASRASLQKTFPYAGYYAVSPPSQPDLKVIALNSVLFSYKSRGEGVESAADAQIKWFVDQLASAKKHKQKVIIAMHIPVGIDVYATLHSRLFTLVEFWKPQYATRFKSALEAYAATVVGVFSGHLHSDWFQVLTLDHGQEVAITGTPAISPLFGNNPGFKVYRYAQGSRQIEDYYTYYLPIYEHGKWGKEYEFDRVYQPNCQHCSILDGMKYLQKTGSLSKKYKRYYALGTNAQPIGQQWDPYYWCDVQYRDVNAYRACVSRSMASR